MYLVFFILHISRTFIIMCKSYFLLIKATYKRPQHEKHQHIRRETTKKHLAKIKSEHIANVTRSLQQDQTQQDQKL